jgi:hypothetical protein
MTLSPFLLLQSGLALGILIMIVIPDTSFNELRNFHFPLPQRFGSAQLLTDRRLMGS